MKRSSEMLSQCACARVRTLARVITKAYDDALRPLDLKASQLSVLAAVDSMETPSIAALSKELLMDRTTLSRNLGPLSSSGFIALIEDGRSKTIRITEAGRKIITAAYPLWKGAQDNLLRQIGESFVKTIDKPLQRLTQTG